MLDSAPAGSLEMDFERFAFVGRLVGGVASRALSTGARGRVLAVFDNSFYVVLEAGLVCVGGASLAAGPLNLVTAAPVGTNWRVSGLRVDDRVSVVNRVLRVGPRFRFNLAETTRWTPASVAEGWTAADLERGLKSFRQTCSGYAFAQGLGGFIHGRAGPEIGASIHQQAREPVESLDQWLNSVFRDPRSLKAAPSDSLAGLLGLGPGLTPSGDDYVGGMMIAARCIGEAAACGRLWKGVRPLAERLGNPITLAHLAAASEGIGNIRFHRAINAIVTGQSDRLGTVIAGIDTIGHGSGWDAMAGAVRLLDAWLRARADESGRATFP
jgi:hypothetical protein